MASCVIPFYFNQGSSSLRGGSSPFSNFYGTKHLLVRSLSSKVTSYPTLCSTCCPIFVASLLIPYLWKHNFILPHCGGIVFFHPKGWFIWVLGVVLLILLLNIIESEKRERKGGINNASCLLHGETIFHYVIFSIMIFSRSRFYWLYAIWIV